MGVRLPGSRRGTSTWTEEHIAGALAVAHRRLSHMAGSHQVTRQYALSLLSFAANRDANGESAAVQNEPMTQVMLSCLGGLPISDLNIVLSDLRTMCREPSCAIANITGWFVPLMVILRKPTVRYALTLLLPLDSEDWFETVVQSLLRMCSDHSATARPDGSAGGGTERGASVSSLHSMLELASAQRGKAVARTLSNLSVASMDQLQGDRLSRSTAAVPSTTAREAPESPLHETTADSDAMACAQLTLDCMHVVLGTMMLHDSGAWKHVELILRAAELLYRAEDLLMRTVCVRLLARAMWRVFTDLMASNVKVGQVLRNNTLHLLLVAEDLIQLDHFSVANRGLQLPAYEEHLDRISVAHSGLPPPAYEEHLDRISVANSGLPPPAYEEHQSLPLIASRATRGRGEPAVAAAEMLGGSHVDFDEVLDDAMRMRTMLAASPTGEDAAARPVAISTAAMRAESKLAEDVARALLGGSGFEDSDGEMADEVTGFEDAASGGLGLPEAVVEYDLSDAREDAPAAQATSRMLAPNRDTPGSVRFSQEPVPGSRPSTARVHGAGRARPKSMILSNASEMIGDDFDAEDSGTSSIHTTDSADHQAESNTAVIGTEADSARVQSIVSSNNRRGSDNGPAEDGTGRGSTAAAASGGAPSIRRRERSFSVASPVATASPPALINTRVAGAGEELLVARGVDDTHLAYLPLCVTVVCVSLQLKVADMLSWPQRGEGLALGSRGQVTHLRPGGPFRVALHCTLRLICCGRIEYHELGRSALGKLLEQAGKREAYASHVAWALHTVDQHVQDWQGRAGNGSSSELIESLGQVCNRLAQWLAEVRRGGRFSNGPQMRTDAREWMQPAAEEMRLSGTLVARRSRRVRRAKRVLAERTRRLGGMAEMATTFARNVQAQLWRVQVELWNQEEQARTMHWMIMGALWKEVATTMLGERGPLESRTRVDNGWILDGTWTPARVPTKLVRTPFFNSHAGAVRTVERDESGRRRAVHSRAELLETTRQLAREQIYDLMRALYGSHALVTVMQREVGEEEIVEGSMAEAAGFALSTAMDGSRAQSHDRRFWTPAAAVATAVAAAASNFVTTPVTSATQAVRGAVRLLTNSRQAMISAMSLRSSTMGELSVPSTPVAGDGGGLSGVTSPFASTFHVAAATPQRGSGADSVASPMRKGGVRPAGGVGSSTGSVGSTSGASASVGLGGMEEGGASMASQSRVQLLDGDGAVLLSDVCQLIMFMHSSAASVTLTKTSMRIELRQPVSGEMETLLLMMHNGRQDFVWPLDELREVYSRRYRCQRTAVELFFSSGDSLLIHFPTQSAYEKMVRQLQGLRLGHVLMVLDRKTASLRAEEVAQTWVQGGLTNLDYLLELNKLACRSYNDLNQYYVVPWVVSDYSRAEFDIDDVSMFRDLTKPMGVLTARQEESARMRFNEGDMSFAPFHHGTHYSTLGGVLFFLMRLEPFATLMIQLQNGHFDVPDRLFFSLPSCWHSVTSSSSDVKELIPQMYSLPEMYVNVHKFPFGTRQEGAGPVVDDVELPPWAVDAEDLVRKMRAALESPIVTSTLHCWIDLIFGYKQLGKAAEEALNVFLQVTYEGAIDLEKLDPMLRGRYEGMSLNFGQTPSQLFVKPHPQRALRVGRPLSVMRSVRLQLSALAPTGLWRMVESAHVLQVRVCHRPLEQQQLVAVAVSVVREEDGLEGVARKADGADGASVGGEEVPGGELVSDRSAVLRCVHRTSSVFLGAGNLVVQHHGVEAIVEASERHGNRGWFDGVTRMMNVKGHMKAVTVRGLAFAEPTSVRGRVAVIDRRERTLIVGGSWDCAVRLVSLDTGRVRRAAAMHTDMVSAVCADLAMGYVVTGSRDSRVIVWRVSRGEKGRDGQELLPHAQLFGHEAEVQSVAMDVLQDVVVSGSADGTCIVWALTKGVYVRTLRVRRDEAKSFRGVVHVAIGALGSVVFVTEYALGQDKVSGRET
jgi:hypothetical protein